MLLQGLRGALAICLATFAYQVEANTRDGVREIPEHLMFGAASASYQVEGAWDEDGKSESIWDYLLHSQPCFSDDCSNGDVAADSYHNAERDVEMMREMGLDFYRFSLSWTRILPTGFPDQINEAGVAYYNKLIDEMLKYNIQPVITICHWDIPQKLQLMGGWLNPYMIDWFADYAKVVFELFGNRVKYWITLNNPFSICYYGNEYKDILAPGLGSEGDAVYMCSKNLLLAHAKAWHTYDDNYRVTQNGTIGITMGVLWYEPATDSEDDAIAAEEGVQFDWGIYAHPIFSKEGDFPAIVKQRVAAKSAAQGFPRSRLPELSTDEIAYIKGTSDFFGANHYSTVLAYRNASVYGINPVPSLKDDLEISVYQPDIFPLPKSRLLTKELNTIKSVPWGFYKVLNKIRQDFDNPPIFITENGFPNNGGLDDYDRIDYYRNYLDSLINAIDDGCNVIGYTAWSLMDCFEWNSGYQSKLGLYEVDFESPARTRTPRRSAFVYKQILRTRTLDSEYEPDTAVMTIDEGH